MKVNGLCILSQWRSNKQLELFFLLYLQRGTQSPSRLMIFLYVLISRSATQLTVPFLDTEILDALTTYVSSKESGSDGFNFYFYKNAWSFLKAELISVFKEFFRRGKLPIGINSSFWF